MKELESAYVECPKRKGRPRIHVAICRVCKEKKCKVKKNLPRVKVPKIVPKIVTPEPDWRIDNGC